MKLSIIPAPTVAGYLQGYTKAQEKVNEVYESRIPPEGYSLHIENSITLKASTKAGFFYGNQTLSQIKSQCGQNLQNCHIEDSPKYKYRGFMIDSARHFFTVKEIKRMIDNCAKFRFNVFHWHLTDDQGWRIEIKKYPEIIKIGSVRYGNHFRNEQNEKIYGGYYTQEQIKEVVSYAHANFMRVVPEIDIPGHTSALLAAVPSLCCGGKEVKVKTSAGIFKDIVCPGKESSYKILFDILDEVINIFPDEYIHIGGDEAPKNQWKSCPDCQFKILREHLKDEEALQGYFINRVAEYLESRGKKTVTWNDSLKSGNLKDNVTVQLWMDKKGLCNKCSNEIIASDFYHCYTDYPYAMTPLKKAYEYEPELNGKVMGLETPVWTEYISNINYMEYMCFPRFIATAQRAWSKNKIPYKEFKEQLYELSEYFSIKGMAPYKDWDPPKAERPKEIISHFGSIAPNEKIRKLFSDKNK